MAYPLFRAAHFRILAEALKQHGGTLCAADLADVMEHQNAQFNRKLFLEAATHVQFEHNNPLRKL